MLNGLESRTYERFLRLPVAVVVAVLWLVGAVLAGMSVLVLYLEAWPKSPAPKPHSEPRTEGRSRK
jgi:hypothetical protein